MTMTKAFRDCPGCGMEYEVEIEVSEFTGREVPTQSHCNGCLQDNDDHEKRLKARKKPLHTPSNVDHYDDFDPLLLPSPTKLLASEILDWSPGGKGIGLFGVTDLGKSYLLFEIARRCENEGFNVAVVQDHLINDLVLPENRSMRRSLEHEIDRANVVLWDDFGTAGMTDAVEKFLNRNLESLNKRKVPILGSCNYSGAQIKKNWADSSDNLSWLEDRGEKLARRFRRDSKWYKFDRKEKVWK